MNENIQDTSTSQLFSSKIKLRIFYLFEIYQKLTLHEISEKLSRDKSSIHPHIQKLIEMGFIKQPTKVDENRSFIFERSQKQLSYNRGLDFSLGLTPEFISQMLRVKIDICIAEKMLIEESLTFWKKLEKKNQTQDYSEEFYELIKYINDYQIDENGQFVLNEKKKPSRFSKTSSVLIPLEEDTFEEFRKDFNDLVYKYQKIALEKEKTSSQHYPLWVLTKFIPIEKVIEKNTQK